MLAVFACTVNMNYCMDACCNKAILVSRWYWYRIAKRAAIQGSADAAVFRHRSFLTQSCRLLPCTL